MKNCIPLLVAHLFDIYKLMHKTWESHKKMLDHVVYRCSWPLRQKGPCRKTNNTLFQLQIGNMVWYKLSGFYIPRAEGEGNIQSRQRISDHLSPNYTTTPVDILIFCPSLLTVLQNSILKHKRIRYFSQSICEEFYMVLHFSWWHVITTFYTFLFVLYSDEIWCNFNWFHCPYA